MAAAPAAQGGAERPQADMMSTIMRISVMYVLFNFMMNRSGQTPAIDGDGGASTQAVVEPPSGDVPSGGQVEELNSDGIRQKRLEAFQRGGVGTRNHANLFQDGQILVRPWH